MYFCGWGVCEGMGIYGWDVLEGCECIGKEGEEKLHHYIIFVTLSSLVHEKKSTPSVKMTKIENKNCKCSK